MRSDCFVFLSFLALSPVYGEGRLPTPGNLRVSDFTLTSLELAADPVAGASGYRFEVDRIDGVPKAERIERFDAAPQFDPLSGWTVSPESAAKLGSYTKTSADGDAHSLKIGSEKKTAVLLSPKCPAPITEYSFMYKGGSRSTDKSNTLRILGRTGDTAEWTEVLSAFSTVRDNAKHWLTNRLETASGIVQLKFVFEPGTNATTLAVDTLRVVYGGGEKRTAQPVLDVMPTPTCRLSGLKTGTYGFRVQAAGDKEPNDSDWTDEQTLDLMWAEREIGSPENVSASAYLGELSVFWEPVDGADVYRVKVESAAQSEDVLMREVGHAMCSATVSVSRPDDYRVTVEAVAPGGKKRGVSAPVRCRLTPDQLAWVSVKSLKGGVWSEDFNVLAGVSSDILTRQTGLPYWQLMKGSLAAEKVLFTSTRTRKDGGVYVFADEQKSITSYMLGTRATGDFGCSFGIAFKNDREETLSSPTLSFVAIQRNCQTRSASYRLDCKVSADHVSISSSEGWMTVELPELPAYTIDAPFEGLEFRETIGPLKLPVKVPTGQVLVLRWCHDAVASGPMLAVDDVCVCFPTVRKGSLLVLQ